MKLAIILTALALGAINLNAQEPVRIALTPASTVAAGEVANILQSKKNCRGIAVTSDTAAADYTVELAPMTKQVKLDGLSNAAIGGGRKANEHIDYSSTLFNKKGDILFHTKTHMYMVEKLDSAVIDTCKAIRGQK